MNASLQRRLFAWLAGSILVVAALVAGLAAVLSWRDANDLQDRQLAQLASVFALAAALPAPARFEPLSGEDAETHFVVKALGATPADPNPRIDLALPASLAPGFQTLAQRGVQWRVLASRNAAGIRFAVAQRMTVRDEIARDAAVEALVPLLVSVPVLLLVVGAVLRRSFAPLVALSREVDGVDGSHLGALSEHAVPLEALPLVQAMNRLLRRLALALEQQRRLVSDAAHELRTPVAVAIVQADNVLHVAMPEAARQRMSAMRDGLGRMATLIEQLLDFARVQGAATGVPEAFELDAHVRHAIEESLALAQARQVDLGCVRLDRARLHGDAMHAYALVRNAIDNAVRYTPAGGAIDVSVAAADGELVFAVEDTGPGITPADLERVFDPFVRVLGNEAPGSGLGLAIARTAANALGGVIRLGARADGRTGLRFEYRQRLE